MADKIDFKDFSIQPYIHIGKSPYRFGDGYSEQELLQLKDYMHQNFRHLRYGGNRSKGIIIEYPPSQIASMHIWKGALDAILGPELESLNPKLRNSKIIVRFDNGLYDDKKKIEVAGNNKEDKFTNGETWIRINRHRVPNSNQFVDIKDAIYVILHEIFEGDFWSKTHNSDKEAHEDNNKGPLLAMGKKYNEYQQLLDEKVANRRAVKAMKRYWPDFELDLNYEEDKI